MMRRFAVCLGLVTAAAVVVPLAGQFNAISDQPAATLLLPYFEVDLDRPAGMTTLFSVNNASAAPALARVVVWSDLAVPVLGFNLYLTGYDVERLDMRDIIAGQIPLLPPFNGCAPVLPPEHDVRNALTGQASASLDNMCAGLSHGGTGSIARGYVTIDSTSACTTGFPGDAGYFVAGGTGEANNNNLLWGDYMLVERRTGSGEADPLVHIRADSTDPQLSTAGDYTFYGRYVGWNASDNREPLSTTFGARSRRIGDFPETHVTVWRDTKESYTATSATGAFTCGTTPAWYPLGHTQIVEFDENEDDPVEHLGLPDDPPPFPAAAQRVEVGGPALPSLFTAGWYYFNLNTSAPGPPAPDLAQAWVTVLHRDISRYFTGSPAVLFSSARQ